MASNKYDELATVHEGRRDWKIRVKVVRLWRGYTKDGQPFNNFNTMLIDKQETKIHAFIPAKCTEELESKLAVGNICSITNFDVEKHKPDDRFRCVLNDYRLVFSEDTKVKQVDEKDSSFPEDTFDFYDHADLMSIAGTNVYLTDVIGIINNRNTIRLTELQNRLGVKQAQLKFTITDGSSNVKVTFWDAMAKKLYADIQKAEEDPVILILAAAKIGKWKSEVDISHVAATHFFINHNHHSVKQIRKSLQDPKFTQKINALCEEKKTELIQLSKLQTLGMEYMKIEVMAHATIKYVDVTESWFINICTKCKNEVLLQNDVFRCNICKRRIPHPEKRYRLSMVLSDHTAGVEIIMLDRAVRTLVGVRAHDLYNETKTKNILPAAIKGLQKMLITVKFSLTAENIAGTDKIYLATDVCSGHYTPQQQSSMQTESNNYNTEVSTSTIHLDGISQLQVNSEN